MRGTIVPSSRYHSSLQGIREDTNIPADLVAKVLAAAACCQPRGAEKVPVFLTSSSGLSEVRALRQALALALRAADVRDVPVASIAPHVTLIYADREVDEFAISPVRWVVREFVLVHSVPGDRAAGRGRTYIRLGTWTLGD